MTLISTGSTLTPCFSSHLLAALISARLPSSSKLTTPISSVMLAWRILVTKGNFWPSFQMSGSLMSRGGNINHSRLCSAALDEADLPGRSVFDALAMGSSAGDSGNDANLIPVLERRLLVLQETDVFFVHIDIDEAAHLAFFIY